MNYSPDHRKILGYLHEMREQISQLSEQQYNEESAFTLNLLNRKLIDLEKALEMLNINIEPILRHQNIINKAISECYRPIKSRAFDRIDQRIIHYYHKGIKGLQREIDHMIHLLSGRNTNPPLAMN